ncbi:hypothetical protein [Microbulbifer sp. NBRC 101763]|uniref:hypothetical protein n=1 Tax=Microbulbifer sp. NBRC 101763 TaxID=1113820 RepID=UPI00334265F8
MNHIVSAIPLDIPIAVALNSGQVIKTAHLELKLHKLCSTDVSLATSFAPAAGVLSAFFILGKIPTCSQFIGGEILMTGLANFLGAIYLQHGTNIKIHNSISEDGVVRTLDTGY